MQKDKTVYLIEIVVESKNIQLLESSVDEVIQTFLKTIITTLPDGNENIKISFGKTKCKDKSKDHTCIADIFLKSIDN